MANEADDSLGAEEIQIIRALHPGGFGAFPDREYQDALDLLLPRVRISLRDVLDPRARRRNPPTRGAEHRKVHERIKLFRGLAYTALFAVDEPKPEDRNARRRQQRREQADIRAASRIGAEAVAAQLAQQAERRAADQKRDDEQRREHQKETRANVVLILKELFKRHTKLRGERRDQLIGEIMVVLQVVGSSEPTAIKQRFRRIPAGMKAAAKSQR